MKCGRIPDHVRQVDFLPPRNTIAINSPLARVAALLSSADIVQFSLFEYRGSSLNLDCCFGFDTVPHSSRP